jgi:hypothetical protein
VGQPDPENLRQGGRVLRIEVVVHNAKELRSGKMLDKLPTLLARMTDMLVRFLGAVQAAHVSFLDAGAFEGLTQPTTRGTRRLAGIDLNKARNRHVVDAVVELATRPDGFTVAQLAATVRQRSGQDAATYSARNAAYDVAKMVGKSLVRRIERSRRYAVDPPGLRTLCAYLLLREKVIKPLLAGVVRPHGRPPQVATPLGPTLRRVAPRTSANLSNHRPRSRLNQSLPINRPNKAPPQ